MRVIPANSTTPALRRIFFTLVDATDLRTPEDITVTGVRPTGSVDGATPSTFTNDIVKVNGANGEYYIELTQAETNQPTGSVIRGWLTPSGCALSKFEAQIGGSAVFSATPDVNVTSIANNTITAASIATDAITASKVASDAVAEIQNGVVLAAVTHTGATIPTVSTVNGLAANTITAASIATGAFTAPKFAAGAFDAVWTVTTRSLSTFGTLVSDVATAVWSAVTRTLTTFGTVGTDVTAIRARTDNLTFTVTGQVDANVQSINDTTIVGNGSTGNEFRV